MLETWNPFNIASRACDVNALASGNSAAQWKRFMIRHDLSELHFSPDVGNAVNLKTGTSHPVTISASSPSNTAVTAASYRGMPTASIHAYTSSLSTVVLIFALIVALLELARKFTKQTGTRHLKFHAVLTRNTSIHVAWLGFLGAPKLASILRSASAKVPPRLKPLSSSIFKID